LAVPVVGSVVAARAGDHQIQVTRQAASGAGTATLTLLRHPAILLVDREAATASPARTAGVTTDERTLDSRSQAPAFRLLRETRLLPWDMDLAEADVVVAGGRGVGGPAGFDMLATLAGLLGGTVAGSRVAVDNGWLPYARQVGLTGKTVSPALYIACGISGAIHHTLGMRGSSHVIAINTDRDAPVFKLASVSVVADFRDVVPGLIERLRAAAEAPLLAGVGS
jgi:electron transfer flavoprotein alpha subunit